MCWQTLSSCPYFGYHTELSSLPPVSPLPFLAQQIALSIHRFIHLKTQMSSFYFSDYLTCCKESTRRFCLIYLWSRWLGIFLFLLLCWLSWPRLSLGTLQLPLRWTFLFQACSSSCSMASTPCRTSGELCGTQSRSCQPVLEILEGLPPTHDI